LYAFAESDSFLLRDRGENRDHRILENPARIEVRLGETAITDAGPSPIGLGSSISEQRL
jgi:hypothetical protein